MMLRDEAIQNGWTGDQAQEFTDWWNRVNRRVLSKLGIGLRDIRDFDYASAFRAGDDPVEFADGILDELASEAGVPDLFD